MEPTLHTDGGIVVVDIWSYSKPEWLCGWLGCRRMSYKPGDVVICRHPYDEDKKICKRIRGTGGHIVQRRPYAVDRVFNLTIPDGYVWLAGDNPNNSSDSRYYGPVSVDSIIGRVVYKLTTRPPFIERISAQSPSLDEEYRKFMSDSPRSEEAYEQLKKVIAKREQKELQQRKEQLAEAEAAVCSTVPVAAGAVVTEETGHRQKMHTHSGHDRRS